MQWTFAPVATSGRVPVSRCLLLALVGTFVFVSPVHAGTSAANNACFAEADGTYFSATITTSGSAVPDAYNPGSIVLWNTSVQAVFAGTTMVAGYNLGLLAAGDNNIPVDIVSTIHASNSVEGTLIDVQSVAAPVTVSDPDGTRNTGDETATPLVINLGLPDSNWTPTGGDMAFTQGTYTLTAHLAGGAVTMVPKTAPTTARSPPTRAKRTSTWTARVMSATRISTETESAMAMTSASSPRRARSPTRTLAARSHSSVRATAHAAPPSPGRTTVSTSRV